MSSPKILFIVEGADKEKVLYKKLTSAMGIKASFFSVCANIHMLYDGLKKSNFLLNIDDFLLTLKGVSEEDRKTIQEQKPFTYIYLIFDLDLQHYNISIAANIKRGLDDVGAMLDYFNDETDPTIGKMYINYPMIESYRDCIDFFDESYREKKVYLYDIVKYKSIVGKRGNSTNISKYTIENFKSLTKMNLFKANYIVKNLFNAGSYFEYLAGLNQEKIFNKQEKYIINSKEVYVLHSGFFFMIDYWGNKQGFYDDLLKHY